MACRIPWCRSSHSNGCAHWAELPDVGNVSLLLLLSDVDDQPLVRVSYPAPELARLDLTPQLAADLADLLGNISPEQLGALRGALQQSADTLGGAV